MPFARASNLDRLFACAGSAVLPHGPDERSERTKEAADWGTMAHHWKETGEVIEVGGRKKLPALFRRKLEKSGVTRERWWPGGMRHEVALALDPVSGDVDVCTSEGKDAKEAWKTGHDDRWCTGTLDGCAEVLEGSLWIDDLKTGRLVSLEDYRYQLLFYALAAARHYKFEGKEVHVTLTHWPRYPVDGQPVRIGEVVTMAALANFQTELADLRRRILTGVVRLETGSHCLYCPAKLNCKAYGIKKATEETDERSE